VAALLPRLNSPDREQRYRAAVLLGECGAAAVPALTRLLRDGTLLERPAAASALGHTRHRSALLPLVRALRHADPSVRERAVAALGYLRLARAYPALAWVLQCRRGEERALAVVALGQLGDQRAVEPLSRCLSDPGLAESAAQALGNLGSTEAIPQLIRAVEFYAALDTGAGAANACAWALGVIGAAQSVPALCKVAARAKYLRATGLRETADTALMNIGEAGIEALATALGQKDTAEVAGSALARLGAAALPPLCKLALEADRATRLRALGVLDMLRDPRAVPTLLHLLADADPGIRGEAVRLLGVLNVTAVVPHVQERLADPADEVRWRAAVTLAGLGDVHLDRAPLLTAALEDRHEGVRILAARALTWLAKLHASHRLRQALPALRRLEQPWRAGSLDAKEAYMAAAQAIEAATADTRALPLAAAPTESDGLDLPRAAEAPEPDPADLPRVADE